MNFVAEWNKRLHRCLAENPPKSGRWRLISGEIVTFAPQGIPTKES